MSWNYAELSKLARANGGPEKLVDLLVNSGKKKMIPIVGAAVLGGVALTLGVQKLIAHFSKLKDVSDKLVEDAKQEIIQGIKEYDAEQDEQEEDTLRSINTMSISSKYLQNKKS